MRISCNALGVRLLYAFLYILGLQSSLYGACIPYSVPVGTTIWQILDTIQSVVAGPENPNIIRTAQTITTPGYYVVAGNNIGHITINSDNVFLYLHGRTVNGITVAPAFPATLLQNIIIIEGFSATTIDCTDVQNLWIENINFTFGGAGVITSNGIALDSCANVYLGRIRGKNFDNLISFNNCDGVVINEVVGAANQLITGASANTFVRNCVGMRGGQDAASFIGVFGSTGTSGAAIEDCIVHGGFNAPFQTIEMISNDAVIKNCSGCRYPRTLTIGIGSDDTQSNLLIDDCFAMADVGFRVSGDFAVVRKSTASAFSSQGFIIFTSPNCYVTNCLAALPVNGLTAFAFFKSAIVGTDFLNNIGAHCTTNFFNTAPAFVATLVGLPTATYWMNASL